MNSCKCYQAFSRIILWQKRRNLENCLKFYGVEYKMIRHRQTAAIIGAGVAGMATAIRLVNKGFKVSVFEANAYPGGKLSAFEQQGFRFDAGPSLFTLPQLVDELFALSGKKPLDYFEYIRLPIVCQYFYEDGTRITAYGQPEKFALEIEQKTGEPKAAILHFLTDSQTKYDLTAEVFLHRSLHKATTYFNAHAWKGYTNFLKLDAFRTMHKANKATFKDPRVVQLFNRYATYNGSNPYQTPATMNIIPHLEYNIGAYFPKQGMHAITQSLVKLAEDLGVQFVYQAPVQQVVTANQQATGIQVNNTFYPFDIVVSNMDIVNTYKKLLPSVKQPKKNLEPA